MEQRKSRTIVAAVGVLLAVALVASACKSSSNNNASSSTTAGGSNAKSTDSLPDEGTPSSGGKMVIGVNAETNGWDPFMAQWAEAGNFVGSSFLEPMAVFDAEGNTVPWLAESWKPSADNQTWTIKLRQGVKFHNGSEMTSTDVKADFDLASGDGLTSLIFSGIITGVDAPDKYTVVVHLSFPWAVFPTVLASGAGWVLPQTMIDSADRGANQPVGTGAYKFQTWTPDKSLTVVKFPDYWGGPCSLSDPGEAKKLCDEAGVPAGQKNGPYLDQMEFRPITDAQDRASALKAGDLNMMMSTSAEHAATFKTDYQVVKDYDSEQNTVTLNTIKPPFDNIHARKALAYATDRSAMVARVDFGEGVKSDTSPFEQASPWGGKAPDQTGYVAFDQEKAKQELALYTKDTGQPTLSFPLLGTATVDEIADMQQLQEMWHQVGIEATIDTVEQTAFLTKLVGGEYQAAYITNYGYPEPDFNYIFWSQKNAKDAVLHINFTGYATDTTENALLAGRTSADRQVRQDAYDALVKERNENVVELWLYNSPAAIIADKNVRGLNWFRALPFANAVPKPWVGGFWLST